MQYEVFIPAPDENGFDVTLVVEAHNWMAALKTGLERCGEGAHAVRSVVCDIQADNSVHVTDAGSMRVFRLKPLPEPTPTPTPDKPPLERPTEALPTLQAHAPAFTAPIPVLTQAIYQVEVSAPTPKPTPTPQPSPPPQAAPQPEPAPTPQAAPAPEPAPAPAPQAAPTPEPTPQAAPEPETVLVPPPEPTPTLPHRDPSAPDLAALDAVALPLDPHPLTPPPLASPPAPELIADLNKVTAPVPANFREVLARELAHELTQAPAPTPAHTPKVIIAEPTPPTGAAVEPAPAAAPPLEAPPAPRTFHPTSRTIIGEMPAVHFGQARISSQAKEKGVVSTPDSGSATIARVLREQHTHSGADLKARPTIQIGRIDIQTQVADNALEDVFLEIPPIFDGMSIAEAADFVLNLAMDKIRSESGSILFTTSKGDELFFATARGPKAADVKDYRIPMGEGVAGFCAREGVCLLIADVKSDQRFYEAISRSMGYEVTSLLCAPIQYQRRVYGCIELINPTDRSTYSHAQLNALKYMGEEFGQMIMETHMRQE